MRSTIAVAVILVATGPALAAEWTCPTDTDTCRYTVNTGETGKVRGGGGKTADLGVWINAASGHVLANQRIWVASQNGVHPKCEIEATRGEMTLNVQGFNVKVYRGILVRAHAETGSGAQAEGRTAHMHCAFEAQQRPQS